MSYDIYIGEGVAHWPGEKEMEEWDETEPRIEVRGEHLDSAPLFPGDEMTGQGNSRHPGYSQWAEFCRRTGLHDLFFDSDTGLMRSHPGCFALRANDLETVRAALKQHEEKWPSVVSGWCPCEACKWSGHGKNDGHRPEFNQPTSGDRARLLWLEFWMNHALETYEHAAISNR